MLFGEKILDYWDDILKDLATVVAIPSVAKPQEGEHPFGEMCIRDSCKTRPSWRRLCSWWAWTPFPPRTG